MCKGDPVAVVGTLGTHEDSRRLAANWWVTGITEDFRQGRSNVAQFSYWKGCLAVEQTVPQPEGAQLTEEGSGEGRGETQPCYVAPTRFL